MEENKKGRRRMINSKRNELKKQKLLQDRVLLIKEAMELGAATKSDISNATGLKLTTINNVFTADRELFAQYSVLRRTIVDIASDNVYAIVSDPKHPQHFQASKYVLQNFKSDLDEVLESQKDEEVSLGFSGDFEDNVKIVFTKKSKDGNGEE